MSRILDLLRQTTRHRHAAIERVVPLFRSGADEDDYTAYLQALYAFHVPVEAGLARVEALPALGLALESRAKAPRLKADLLALGMPPSQIARLACADAPLAVDVPSALGILYVLEGSTLGGQVVLRDWQRRFPEVMAKASSYLRGYGEDTGEKWKAFLAVLDVQGRESALEERIVQFACEAFDALHARFAQLEQVSA